MSPAENFHLFKSFSLPNHFLFNKPQLQQKYRAM
jgi:hypothetical protein